MLSGCTNDSSSRRSRHVLSVQKELSRLSWRQSGGRNWQRPKPATALLNVSVLPAHALSALQPTSSKRALRSKALQLQPYVIRFAALNLVPSDMS